jgi:phage repressor protein C with HTH and peptisase S24 domain
MSWATHHIAKLQAGQEVSFRPRGSSMSGKIESGQLVTVNPDVSTVTVGDVVLCKVAGKHYLHLVNAIQDGRYQIANNRGHINGWTTTLYGRVTRIES